MAKKKKTPAKDFHTLYNENPHFHILHFDSYNERAVRLLKLTTPVRQLRLAKDQQSALLEDLRLEQRLLRIEYLSSGNAKDSSMRGVARQLKSAGFRSANSIAAIPQHKFIRTYAKLFDGDEEKTLKIYRAAKNIAVRTNHLAANLHHTLASPHFRAMPAGKPDKELAAYYENIPGYQQLFGSLNYIGSDQCQSIFSPAAYFLDMMRIADDYITDPNTHKPDASGKTAENIPDAYLLSNRRPDLFELELNCANTNNLVPYLQIVNSVLERRLVKELQVSGTAKAIAPTTITLADSASDTTNEYKGMRIVITTGMGTGQARIITSYDAVRKLATVDSPWYPLIKERDCDYNIAHESMSGTALAITDSSIKLAANTPGADNAYTGMGIYIITGDGAGQSRTITSYTSSSNTATIDRPWSPVPVAKKSIYRIDGTPMQSIAVAKYPLNLPFNLPLVQIRKYAEAMDVSLAEIYKRFNIPVVTGSIANADTSSLKIEGGVFSGKDLRKNMMVQITSGAGTGQLRKITGIDKAGKTLTLDKKWGITPDITSTFIIFDSLAADREYIGLSMEEYKIITNTEFSRTLLASYYRDATPAGTSPANDVESFLSYTGLDWKQLDSLLVQELSNEELLAGIAKEFYINNTSEPGYLEVYIDKSGKTPVYRIKDLTWKRLDRVTRFMRLARTLSWSYASLNCALVSLGGNTGPAFDISEDTIKSIAGIKFLQLKSGFSVEELCSFWSDIKTTGRGSGTYPQDLFDKIFNNPALLNGQNPYSSNPPIPFDPSSDKTSLSWEIADVNGTNGIIRSRLSAALQLDGNSLTVLGKYVKDLVDGPTILPGILKLNLTNLSWLYRLAKAASCFHLKIDGYLILLKLIYPQQQSGGTAPPPTLKPVRLDVYEIILQWQQAEWYQSLPFTVYKIDYLLNGVESANYKPAYKKDDILPCLQNLWIASEAARVKTGSFVSEDIDPKKSVDIFENLSKNKFINDAGIILTNETSFNKASLDFLLTAESFPSVGRPVIFEALQRSYPPLLLNTALPTKKQLSCRYNEDNPLDFLFVADPNADFKRNQIRAVLSGTKRKIQAKQFAALFPLGEDSFVNDKITQKESQEIFLKLKTIASPSFPEKILEEPPAAVATFPKLTKLIPVAGILNPDFDEETSLDFLFPTNAPAAKRKATALKNPLRGATSPPPLDTDPHLKKIMIRKVLLDQKRKINNVIDILNDLSALQRQTFLNGLAGLLDTSSEMLAAALPFVDKDKNITDYLSDFLKPPTDDQVSKEVYKLVSDASSAVTIFKDLSFSPKEMITVLNKPAAFDISPSFERSYQSIQRLAGFKMLQRAIGDNSDTLITCFYLPQNQQGNFMRISLLAGLTGWNATQLLFLAGKLKCGYDDVEGIEKLRKCFDVAARAEIDINSLLQIEALGRLPLADSNGTLLQANWLTYVNQSDIIQAAVSTKFKSEEFNKVNAENTASLNDQKRNALLWYSIWRLNKSGVPLNKPSDLYQYLLIDVEMGGIDNVSYIAQAICSIQLYMQRCLMMLEPGVTDMEEIPAIWWKWISSYRLWEANRKVFLYPENYIDPALRKNATPAFESFADALKQTNISEETVEASYKDYFAELSELTSLVNGESCQCTRSVPGRKEPVESLFFFGRTNTQPYTYYYRCFDNQYAWTHWQKMDITINSLFVSPVFAFNKLFVFWTELEEIESSKMEGNDSIPITALSATIKFSFLNDQQTWVQPQVLKSGIIVNYQSDYKFDSYAEKRLLELNKKFDTDHFDINQACWQVPNALQVTTNAFKNKQQYPNTECILINYGFSIRIVKADVTETKLDEPKADMPAMQFSFDKSVYDFITLYDDLRKITVANASVDLNFLYPIYMDANFNINSLSTTYINDPPGQNCPRYRPIIARTTNKLAIASLETSNVVAENYYPDDFSRYPRKAETGPQNDLLSNISGKNASLITVKNKPGRFIFDNGDEAFLVSFAERTIPDISANVIVRTPDANNPAPQKFSIWNTGYFTPTEFNALQFSFTRLNSNVVSVLNSRLISGGIDKLLSIESQETPELKFDRFSPVAGNVVPPEKNLDFNGAYGEYFWETFFHAPSLVAKTLSVNKRHEEARKWYQYIYNPTQPPDYTLQPVPPREENSKKETDRFWRFLPFRPMTIESLSQILTNKAQIAAYNNDPFDPDAIARLRISAYAKSIVMQYIDNLLEWADHLYAQDTRESITEAVNLYVMAADLLGNRPQQVGEFKTPKSKSFNDIKKEYSKRKVISGKVLYAGDDTLELAEGASDKDGAYDGMYVEITAGPGAGQEGFYIVRYEGRIRKAFIASSWVTRPDDTSDYLIYEAAIPEFLIRLENAAPSLQTRDSVIQDISGIAYNNIDSYFSIPENQYFIGYWDKVEDRLYKIRHGMNISGQARTLALFAPPIDPRQAGSIANGDSRSSSAMQIPLYRFVSMIDRAKSLVSTLTTLGLSFLSVLEKKDAEALNLLRASQEKAMLILTTFIKEQQVEELVKQKASLNESLRNAAIRNTHYNQLIATGLSPEEISNIISTKLAMTYSIEAGIIRTLSSIGFAIPNIGSPFAMTYGGQQIGSVLNAAAGAMELGTTISTYMAQLSLTMAGYQRRESDWRLQADLAAADMEQIQYQLQANEVSQLISKKDLANHKVAIEQSATLEAFFENKFTNMELYQWMTTRLANVYFQTYSLAYELSLSCERAYQFELNTNTSFINYGYWNNLQKGLTAGEGLMLALNQMEKSYIDNNNRTLEIEKTISLMQVNPKALLDLVNTGECIFECTEKLFDDDFPGHYARKIKTISISIPAIVGPYQNINATLTQLSNQVIIKPDPNAVNYLLGGSDASMPGNGELRSNWLVNQQIALSGGVNDYGMFELNFNAERYLPFEGTGAVSSWRLSMPTASNIVDFNSISDVIVTMKYTAIDGGTKFRTDVTGLAPMKGYYGSKFLNLSTMYSSQWFEFLNSPVSITNQDMSFGIGNLQPVHISDAKLTGFYFELDIADKITLPEKTTFVQLVLPGIAAIDMPLDTKGKYLHVFKEQDEVSLKSIEGTGKVDFILSKCGKLKKGQYLNPEAIKNIKLIFFYTGTIKWS